ncbi:cyclic nucleotide-binding domain protein (macronuclear) [Tetrahymena thermophila SB210]|uniref:Cyclic nucleotide-binding domain protein n=1 Tax=Tetrahymena thermophila (strain SB210) TaxID=312017 RepID=W7XB74_TETTS|nr:cyclic nucleotide-binding domain protein [Tetrahymena thermophila SB210]EWS73668.1 cyclic nucleotide-binding domain protein [Tetrahymena thermophila SB210]|eukprot:XP_012653798.1 cyclic nucleotide-binding domain protein [Tetrahymena thermophila SB210]
MEKQMRETEIFFQTDEETDSQSIQTQEIFNQDLQTSTEQTSVKSQIQIAKSMNQIRNHRDSLYDNLNLDNLEDIFVERQSSMNSNNQTNIKSIDPVKNNKYFQKDDQIYTNYQNEQQQKEHGDWSENSYEIKELCYQNSEITDSQNNFNKLQNQKTLNIQIIPDSTQGDSSQVSLQEIEDKVRNKSNRFTIKNNQNNQEDNSQSDTDEQENFNKNQTSNNNIKNMEFINAQNQINKIEKQEKLSSNKINKKSFSNQESNNFLNDNKRNNSEIFTSLSKQNGSQEKILNELIQLNQDQLQKNEDQNIRKQKFSLNNKDFQQLSTQIFLEQSNQNVIRKICKMLSMQGSKIFNIIDQQPSEFKIVSGDFILKNFDVIQNYKKFFPHNKLTFYY